MSSSISLILNMKDAYSSGLFSDLTLVCGGEEFKVHRLILWAQSPVFRKLLAGEFKEATSEQQRIVLEDDEPAHLSTLLKYLYHFVYDDSARNSTFESPSTFNIKLYAIADKYNVLAVQMDAASKFAATCDPKTNETDFIQAIYTVDEYTSSYDAKLWEILMPKIKSNLLSLLAVKEFKDLLQEKPELNIRLLEVLGTSAAQDDPLVIELMIKASEQPTGWFEIRYSGGQGRRLG